MSSVESGEIEEWDEPHQRDEADGADQSLYHAYSTRIPYPDATPIHATISYGKRRFETLAAIQEKFLLSRKQSTREYPRMTYKWPLEGETLVVRRLSDATAEPDFPAPDGTLILETDNHKISAARDPNFFLRRRGQRAESSSGVFLSEDYLPGSTLGLRRRSLEKVMQDNKDLIAAFPTGTSRMTKMRWGEDEGIQTIRSEHPRLKRQEGFRRVLCSGMTGEQKIHQETLWRDEAVSEGLEENT